MHVYSLGIKTPKLGEQQAMEDVKKTHETSMIAQSIASYAIDNGATNIDASIVKSKLSEHKFRKQQKCMKKNKKHLKQRISIRLQMIKTSQARNKMASYAQISKHDSESDIEDLPID